jgi:hypothetical protein
VVQYNPLLQEAHAQMDAGTHCTEKSLSDYGIGGYLIRPGIIAIVGLPALWEAQPHLHPSALFCRSSCTASPLALLAPDRDCGSIALTLMKKRAVDSSVLSVNLVRRPPTMAQARAFATCVGHYSRAAPQDNLSLIHI